MEEGLIIHLLVIMEFILQDISLEILLITFQEQVQEVGAQVVVMVLVITLVVVVVIMGLQVQVDHHQEEDLPLMQEAVGDHLEVEDLINNLISLFLSYE